MRFKLCGGKYHCTQQFTELSTSTLVIIVTVVPQIQDFGKNMIYKKNFYISNNNTYHNRVGQWKYSLSWKLSVTLIQSASSHLLPLAHCSRIYLFFGLYLDFMDFFLGGGGARLLSQVELIWLRYAYMNLHTWRSTVSLNGQNLSEFASTRNWNHKE